MALSRKSKDRSPRVEAAPPPGLELVEGARVRFVVDNLGGCARGDLGRVSETFHAGTEGVLAFPHPNREYCAGWFFVEVPSRLHPGELRYVGVAPRHVAPLELPERVRALLERATADDPAPENATELPLAEALVGLGWLERVAEAGATFAITQAGVNASTGQPSSLGRDLLVYVAEREKHAGEWVNVVLAYTGTVRELVALGLAELREPLPPETDAAADVHVPDRSRQEPRFMRLTEAGRARAVVR
jgi:hypothetical protein